MQHRFHLTRLSANKKLGGLPASVTSSDTCPTRCSLKKNGCYADSGPINNHWRAVDDGRRGTNLDDFCAEIRTLPKHQLWRWAQAGDLPGNGRLIDKVALRKLVNANRGRHGYGYTHYDPRIKHNAEALTSANEQGFTLSVSAETLDEADEFVALGVAPVVVILPTDQVTPLTTPAGHTVIVCPASTGNSNCALCGICAVSHRRAVVGFPAHGTSKKKVEKVFWAQTKALQPA